MDLSKLKATLNVASDQSIYTPTEDQRRAKSAYWSYFTTGDALPPPEASLKVAMQYSGDKRIKEWWGQSGFQEWFLNKDEFRQRVEFLADLALDQLYLLIKSPETQANAKVAAIRMIMDVGKKTAQKAPNEESVVGEKIASMGKQELEAFIKAKMTKLSIQEEDPDQIM